MDGDENFNMNYHGTRGNSGGGLEAKAFRFTQDTAEYKLLKKLVESGKVKPSDRPSDIKDQYAESFGKIPSNSFRSQFNKLKNLYGVNTKAGKTFVDVRLQCTLDISNFFSLLLPGVKRSIEMDSNENMNSLLAADDTASLPGMIISGFLCCQSSI